MTIEIHPHFQQLGNDALDNYNKSARARFQGNDGVPIEANISPEKLVNALQTAASGNSEVHTQAKEMLQKLAHDNEWNIPAGVHEGGLGGDGRAADPNKHITLSTGHHVQLGNNDSIKNITGPGISDKRIGKTGPSETERQLADLKAQHGLTDRQAVKAQLLRNQGLTENQAVAQVKSRR